MGGGGGGESLVANSFPWKIAGAVDGGGGGGRVGWCKLVLTIYFGKNEIMSGGYLRLLRGQSQSSGIPLQS